VFFAKFRGSSDFPDLFSLRDICRICPWGCGPGPPVSAHGSTNSIKRRSLATESMALIKSSELVSRLLISAVHHRSDGRGGWLRPGAARACARGSASRPSATAHRSLSFHELRWSVSVEVCSYRITAMRGTRLW
jgi:hypothetical protein